MIPQQPPANSKSVQVRIDENGIEVDIVLLKLHSEVVVELSDTAYKVNAGETVAKTAEHSSHYAQRSATE